MNPGNLREVIEVWNATVSASDQYGQADPDPYEKDGTLRASIDSRRGSSVEQGGAERGRDRITVRVRSPLPSGITIKEQTQVKWDGETYDVQTWEKEGRRRQTLAIDAVRR